MLYSPVLCALSLPRRNTLMWKRSIDKCCFKAGQLFPLVLNVMNDRNEVFSLVSECVEYQMTVIEWFFHRNWTLLSSFTNVYFNVHLSILVVLYRCFYNTIILHSAVVLCFDFFIFDCRRGIISPVNPVQSN